MAKRKTSLSTTISRSPQTCILCGEGIYYCINGKAFCLGCTYLINGYAESFIKHWDKFLTEHGFEPLDMQPAIDAFYIHLINVLKQPVQSWGFDDYDLLEGNNSQLINKLLWNKTKEYVESLVKIIIGYPSDLYITKPVEE